MKIFKPLLLLFALASASQLTAQQTISGKITDAKDAPLAGASVSIKNSTSVTSSGSDGRFSLKATPSDTLEITFIGYEKQFVAVGQEKTFLIKLSETPSKMADVIVTGYSSQSKRNVTGAVSSVSTKDLLSTPSTGVGQALQGRVPGVSISQQGGPGGGTMVRIRGFGTVGDNDPLYVIDGVPTKTGLNDLNPNDIESIQVLKDASAASIYGSRAGNGVVIVTTKSGKTGKAKLSVDSYYGRQFIPKLPGVLTAQQFANMLWTSQTNAGVAPSNPHFGSGTTPVIPEFLSSNVKTSIGGTNWLRQIMNSANLQNYNIGATGGSEAGNYALSLGHLQQDGLLLFTGFKRYTARANTRFKISKKLTIGENLSVSYSNKVGIDDQNTENPITMAMRMPSVLPVYTTDGHFAGSSVGGFNNPKNPVGALTRAKNNKDLRTRVFGNAYLELELLKGLTAKTSFGVDYLSERITNFTGINAEDAEVVGANKLDEYYNSSAGYTWFNTLTYKKAFGKSDLTAYIGTETIQGKSENLYASRTGFFTENPDYTVLNAGSGGISNSGSNTMNRLFSLFGKADYNYDNFLLLSGTIRRDGSSRFGQNNRYGNFPSASAGIRLTKYEPIQKLFDDLKLRIGWGQTGNQQIGDYASYTLYGSDINTTYYPVTGSPNASQLGFAVTQQGNENVKWETTTSTNLGIDATLLQNKLTVTIDLYNRKTRDMLVQVPQPATAGFAPAPYLNIGSMTNKGFDLGLNYKGNAGKLKYDVSFNVSHYKNTVNKLGESDLFSIAGAQAREQLLTRTQAGYPISYFFGYQVDGIFKTASEVSAAPDQGFTNAANGVGRFRYRDINGDKKIDQNDRTIIGSPHPDFTYGLNFNLAYEGFDMAIFFQGSKGNDIYNFTKYFTDFPATFFQSGKGTAVLNAWSPANTGSSIPALTSNIVNNETGPNSYFIEKGSYMRMKNLQVGYTFANALTRKWGIDRLRIYIQAQNLFTITKYKGLDPELSLRSFSEADARITNLDIGVDRGAYPATRALLFGLSLGL